jgi:ribonuclease P protein component
MAQGRSDCVAEIRRTGRRVQGGAWVLVYAPQAAARGRLITALGRKAGMAVTRSRARRVARECYRLWRGRLPAGSALLMARSDLSRQPRRRLRGELLRLFERLASPARHDG